MLGGIRPVLVIADPEPFLQLVVIDAGGAVLAREQLPSGRGRTRERSRWGLGARRGNQLIGLEQGSGEVVRAALVILQRDLNDDPTETASRKSSMLVRWRDISISYRVLGQRGSR